MMVCAREHAPSDMIQGGTASASWMSVSLEQKNVPHDHVQSSLLEHHVDDRPATIRSRLDCEKQPDFAQHAVRRVGGLTLSGLSFDESKRQHVDPFDRCP